MYLYATKPRYVLISCIFRRHEPDNHTQLLIDVIMDSINPCYQLLSPAYNCSSKRIAIKMQHNMRENLRYHTNRNADFSVCYIGPEGGGGG